MNKENALWSLLFLIMALLDIIIVTDARRLLSDFLVGQRNRKNSVKIHSEQTFRNRVSMGYIYPMLKKHKKAFKKYHILYLSVLCSLLPQYLTGILGCFLFPDVAKYIIGVFLVARLFLAVLFRFELGPQKISVYARKK